MTTTERMAHEMAAAHAATVRRAARMSAVARTLAVRLDAAEAQRAAIDAAVTDVLVILATMGVDLSADRLADAVDMLTKLVCPQAGSGTCSEVVEPGLAIGQTRPYPPTGMTTARWQALEPELVDLDHVTTTQDDGDLRALVHGLTRPDSDVYPHVVVWGGRQYLEDGHNRAVRRYLRGQHVQRCRVFRGPFPPPTHGD